MPTPQEVEAINRAMFSLQAGFFYRELPPLIIYADELPPTLAPHRYRMTTIDWPEPEQTNSFKDGLLGLLSILAGFPLETLWIFTRIAISPSYNPFAGPFNWPIVGCNLILWGFVWYWLLT